VETVAREGSEESHTARLADTRLSDEETRPLLHDAMQHTLESSSGRDSLSMGEGGGSLADAQFPLGVGKEGRGKRGGEGEEGEGESVKTTSR
jgi:hypothetical protein